MVFVYVFSVSFFKGGVGKMIVIFGLVFVVFVWGVWMFVVDFDL